MIKAYAKAASFVWAFLAFAGMVVFVGGQVGNNVWLSVWSNDVFLPNNTAEELVPERLGIYALLGMVQGGKDTFFFLISICLFVFDL